MTPPPVAPSGPLTIRQIDDLTQRIESEGAEAIRGLELGGWNVWPALRLHVGFARLGTFPKGRPADPGAVPEVGELLHMAGELRGRVAFLTSSATWMAREANRAIDPRLVAVTGALAAGEAAVLAALRAEEAALHRQGALSPPIDLVTNALSVNRAERLRAGVVAWGWAAQHRSALARLGIGLRSAARSIQRVWTDAAAWERLLAVLEPRHVVLLVAGYGHEGLFLACRRLAIPVSEYQHAVIYPEHVGYNYAAALAEVRGRMLLPDHLLLYGEHWRGLLAERGFFDPGRLVVTGHPSMPEPPVRSTVPPHARRRVLLCTSMVDSAAFRGFVEAYLAESSHAEAVRFVVRQHPRESAPERAAWVETAARFPQAVEISKADTYTEMARCDVQLTGQSSTLYEAIHYGLSTYAVPDPVFAVQESAAWPREAVRIIGFDHRGDFEPLPLGPEVRARARAMWQAFDAERFRRHVTASPGPAERSLAASGPVH